MQIDVREEGQIETLAARTLEHFGRIDVLVNNAGALHWQSVLDTPAKRFDLVMGVNARAAFLCSRAVLPAMIVSAGATSSICVRRWICRWCPAGSPTASPSWA